METRVKEISLYDMLIYIIQRWRALLLWLVIGAVVLGFVGWYTSCNNVEGPLDSIVWENVLTPDEIEAVEAGVEYWNQFNEIKNEPENPVNPESKDYVSKWDSFTKEISARNAVQNYIKSFSDQQKQYFQFLTEKNSNSSAPQEIAPAKKPVSVKYIVLGAIAGLIISAVVISLKYAGSKTIKTVADLEKGYGLQVFGYFDSEIEFDKKHKTKLDKKLKNARRKKKHKLAFEENIELTATKIQIAVEKLNLKNICLITDIENDQDLMTKIVDKLNGKINVTIIKNILAKADALQDMSKMDGAILIEQIDESNDKDINDERLLCSKYGLNIMGVIILE